MKLYGFPPSPNTCKVRAVAAHLNIPLAMDVIDITKGEGRTPGFLKLNPNDRTPVLVDGDFTLWESNAIMQYVADKQPNSLWPEGTRVRADIARSQGRVTRISAPGTPASTPCPRGSRRSLRGSFTAAPRRIRRSTRRSVLRAIRAERH